ncbi:ribonucleoside-diphosphate reductase [Synchytrium endobioticum]|uniref:Ribonucleoside-diphosphate reductase n=1 Tax=Synchytrium endobioticum TaxID=286115 RepID=A0A507CTM0_9FUNG|nr:ribonucleoside-diphosphate reductase [Synchytrium endobioticum]TPX43107.1 ribonucleoside-diphosphate reductase [Synchytrium endobioticum]
MLTAANDASGAVNTSNPMSSPSCSFSKMGISLQDDDWAVPSFTKKLIKEEPLLKPNPKRFVLFPIQYHQIWQAYKSSEAKFWSAEEVELSDDAEGWQRLPGKERTFVLQCLALLATGDGGDLVTRLSEEVQIPEARCFYGFQIMQKHVHLELINVLLDLFQTKPEIDRDVSLSVVTELSSLSKRSAWLATHVLESDEHFGVRIAAVAIFMNVFMSSVIAALLHLTRPGELRNQSTAQTPLPGLIRALAKIQRDIAQYDVFCGLINRNLVNRPSLDTIHRFTADAVSIEKQLITELFEMFGKTLSLASRPLELPRLHKYVQVTADRTLTRLGLAKLYNTPIISGLPDIDTILKEEKDIEDHSNQMMGHGGRANGNTAQKGSGDVGMNVRQEFTLEADF